MVTLWNRIVTGFRTDDRAQDMAEYSLLAAFAVVAASAVVPDFVDSIHTIFRGI